MTLKHTAFVWPDSTSFLYDLISLRINCPPFKLEFQCLLDRNPAQIAGALQATIQEVVIISRQTREEGKTYWLVQ
jgi:hypothetical protein